MRNAFPIYIVSKGRAESRLTNKALVALGVDHFIIVEPQEVEAYERVVQRATVLALPDHYKPAYDCCDDLGMTKSTGPGPARNFAWDHAVGAGAPWHWVMDDNIDGFYRLNYNLKTPAASPAIFAAMEAFVLRYSNVAMAGPNYFMFARRKYPEPALVMNTRIYSCNLIRNDLPFRWRGRYNEDTDLSLRMLKAGWCTVQFNAFLQFKTPTQQIGGGNTAEFYASEGTLPKSKMIAELHPDCARVVEKFGRWHHQVDYSRWKDRVLKRKPGVIIEPGTIDNFGMVLQQRNAAGEWVQIDRPFEKKARYAPSVT